MKTKEQLEKEAALERIIKDKSNVVRLMPGPGYRDKMQVIRTNKVIDEMRPILPITRAIGRWEHK